MTYKRIRLSKSIVGEAEKKALARVIDEGYLGMGEYVRKFEEELAGYFGRRHAVCVNTGTAALHLAVLAAGAGPGDEVLVQSLTYLASFQAISATGARPVPCEVEPRTCTLDLKDAERRITPRTKAIMPVHYASRPGDLDAIYSFADQHGLRVVEDAAHAFGSTHKGRKVGSTGFLVCFSFDGIKNITSGEGGCVLTDDDEAAGRIKDLRLLSVKRDTEKRFSGQRSWEFDVAAQGYRYHMSNLFAAMGLVQLGRFQAEFMPRRQEIAKHYHEALAGVNNIVLFPDDYDETVPHIFPIRVTGQRRDGLRSHLLENEIECGIHYKPNHLLTLYGAKRGSLPVTEGLYEELLTLPLHPGLADEDLQRVISTVKGWLDNA